MGIVADLVMMLEPGKLSREQHKRLANLLDHASSFTQATYMGGAGRDKYLRLNRAIWLLDGGGNPIRVYASTSSGLSSANTDASDGDIILIPAATISGNLSITAGVSVVGWSRYATVLTGQITMGDDSTIENLTISRTADDTNTYKGVINNSSGTAYANCCDIKAVNNGTGNGYAVSMDNNGILELWNCYAYGFSDGGSGYAAYDGGGTGGVVFFGGRASGSTDEFG